MHIPDNYLSPSTCAVIGAAMLPVWAVSIKKVNSEISSVKKIPLLGISAAFSFLIMMLNIPLPGGTTGHAVGASLIAILIGPFSACLTVTVALLIQALFFGDGGILAFGANCFNMAFVMPFSAYFLFRLFNKLFKSEKGKYISVFAAAYISLNLAALFTAFEFGIQPVLFKDASGLPVYSPYPLNVSIPAMLIPHLLIAGFAEAFIAVGVYTYVSKLSPGLIYEEKEIKYKWLYALIFALIIITPLGLLASGTAWGEWAKDEIKELVKFIPEGMKNGINFESIMPDYNIPALDNEVISYIISAVFGAAILLLIFKIISAVIKKKKSDNK